MPRSCSNILAFLTNLMMFFYLMVADKTDSIRQIYKWYVSPTQEQTPGQALWPTAKYRYRWQNLADMALLKALTKTPATTLRNAKTQTCLLAMKKLDKRTLRVLTSFRPWKGAGFVTRTRTPANPVLKGKTALVMSCGKAALSNRWV